MLYRPYDPYTGPMDPSIPYIRDDIYNDPHSPRSNLGTMTTAGLVVGGGILVGAWGLGKARGQELPMMQGLIASGRGGIDAATGLSRLKGAIGQYGLVRGGLLEGGRYASKGLKYMGKGVLEMAHYWAAGHSGGKALAKGLSGAKGMFTPAGLALEGLMTLGMVGYEAIWQNIPPGPNLQLQARGAAMSMVAGAAGAVVGATVLSPIPGIGSTVGLLAGGMIGYMVGTSKTGDDISRIFGGGPIYSALQYSMREQEGFGPRNPFLPGAHGFQHTRDTLTLREASLAAIHKSPLNDRARLLGREAMYMHM